MARECPCDIDSLWLLAHLIGQALESGLHGHATGQPDPANDGIVSPVASSPELAAAHIANELFLEDRSSAHPAFLGLREGKAAREGGAR